MTFSSLRSALSLVLVWAVLGAGTTLQGRRSDRRGEGTVGQSARVGAARADAWRRSKRVAPGIIMKTVEEESPRLQKWFFVRIDTAHERIGFHVTGPSPQLGEPMPDYPAMKQVTVRQRTVDFLNECRQPKRLGGKGLDMVLAVNGAPWRPWCKPWNHRYAGEMGLLVSEGKVVDSTPRGPSLVVYRNGKLNIVEAAGKVNLKKVWCAISGFQIVLEDGQVPAHIYGDKSLAPRVGYGLSKDRRYLYLVLVDGRQPGYSLGATIGEVGEKLAELGAWRGLNMDGGGSSTLVVEKGGKGVVMNRHGSGGYTRTVGASLGVYLKRHSDR